MKTKYYVFHSGTTVRNIAEVKYTDYGQQKTATDYNFKTGMIMNLNQDTEDVFSYESEGEITKREFEQLLATFLQVHFPKQKEVKKTPVKVKSVFKPKTKYQIYGNGIQIFGYSGRSRNELAKFIELYGRREGFRVLDSNGITSGYISPELLNTLSHHLQDIK